MPSRTHRGQGQWAHGHLEPLNAAERFKKDDDGLNVRQRIVTSYAHQGFDSIDPLDLRGRFRWWGLYTQRRPGIGGGKTGALEDAEIEDAFFMMRVRIPGGQLSAEQLRTVAGIAKEYGRDLADITDRQNVQFHWIRIEDVPEIWDRLEGVGLSSLQACGDVPRNILGCPVAGISADEIIDASAVLRATEAVAAGQSRVHQPAAQVQDRDQRMSRPVHRARDQRHLLRRRHRPRRYSRLRPVGGWRPVHQPDARPAPRRVRVPGPCARGVERGDHPLPRLRLPAAAQQGAAEVPGRRLGRGAVPRGPGEGVPRRGAARRAGAAGPAARRS